MVLDVLEEHDAFVFMIVHIFLFKVLFYDAVSCQFYIAPEFVCYSLDGSCRLYRNINTLPIDTAPCLRRPESLLTLLCEPQITQH
jgi:hypothetical protein